jgi:polysaccharide biosynthesis protein VpsQ
MSPRIKILTVVYILILVGIIVLADINGTSYFMFMHYIPYGDKVGHFVLMGMFSLMLNLALRARTIRIWRLNYLLGSLIVAVLVLIEEISQIFVGGRTFDFGDLLSDYAGVLVFGEIARLICRKRLRKANPG